MNKPDIEKYHEFRKKLEDELQCAVPEVRKLIEDRERMIDALIQAVEIIDGEFGYYGEDSTSQPMRDALKKAGVEL